MVPHVNKWSPLDGAMSPSHCDSHHKRIIVILLSLYNDSAMGVDSGENNDGAMGVDSGENNDGAMGVDSGENNDEGNGGRFWGK